MLDIRYEPGLGDHLGDFWIGALLASGALAIALAAFFFFVLRGRWELVAAVLLPAGCLVIGACGFLSLTQTSTIRTPAGIAGFPDVITYKRRYGGEAWYLIYAGMILLTIVAILAFRRGLELSRRRRVGAIPVLLKEGLDHLHHGRFDEAIAAYDRALELDPEQAEARYRRGTARLRKGDLDRALSDFNEALAIDPRHADAYLHRGLVHAARGFHDLAVVDFNTSLDIQPHVLDALLNRGLSRFQLGDQAGASADFRLVLHLTNHSDYADPARLHLQQLGVPC